MLQLLSCIAALLAIVVLANTAESPDETVLKALGLPGGNYNALARPPPDNGTANTVTVSVNLVSLVSVDTAQQQIVMQLWLTLSWTDTRLAWQGKFNSSLDNISSILLPASASWLPDVTFYDLVDSKRVSSDIILLRLMSDGQISSDIEYLTTLKCSMQMIAFPFDVQNCHQYIASMVQYSDTLRLRLNQEVHGVMKLPTDNYTASNEYCLTKATMDRPFTGLAYDRIAIEIEFQRLPTFYIVNLILPSILLLAISALNFCLPPECGERVSFSITIVLSMCVFLQLTGNYTPTQSQSVPVLTLYYSLAVIMTMANVLGNVFVLRCHFWHEKSSKVHSRLVRFLFLNRFILMVFKRSPNREPSENDPTMLNSSSAASENSLQNAENEWRTVVAVADDCLFVAFAFLTCVTVIALAIIQAVTASPDCIKN